eukprot:5530629-Pleurochrysis_carterae.AAC.6
MCARVRAFVRARVLVFVRARAIRARAYPDVGASVRRSVAPVGWCRECVASEAGAGKSSRAVEG